MFHTRLINNFITGAMTTSTAACNSRDEGIPRWRGSLSKSTMIVPSGRNSMSCVMFSNVVKKALGCKFPSASFLNKKLSVPSIPKMVLTTLPKTEGARDDLSHNLNFTSRLTATIKHNRKASNEDEILRTLLRL